jgi:hypothetical protein
VGWITYLPVPLSSIPPLPVAKVQELGDLGTLLVLTDVKFLPADPRHLGLALQTQRELEQAQLL